ncbi:hypothetical protein TRICHSKD4_6282 [Roseibium sp. TrichSKD4]|uniref:FliM/FliN family flagellar motor switch protein n=1 Tax=Roseibium sp. TrichSKD4 TaxID=744980 RepID=UPI0001E57388|nr:FliM/FliN family flagellar motor switch protein [Roseibium sp. TrichSKD4]EFO28577.1 hypothetical protein TRICHSKD4_6282 [Roseibium sp. TrichSKD4]
MTNPRTLQNLEKAIARTSRQAADAPLEDHVATSEVYGQNGPKYAAPTPNSQMPRQRPQKPSRAEMPIEAAALSDRQPETFRQLWIESSAEMPFYDFGFDGELTPAEEWLGDSFAPALQVYGQLGNEEFNLLLSADFVEYLVTQLPEPISFQDGSPHDQALLTEHFLTPLIAPFEQHVGRDLSFIGADFVQAGTAPVDVYGMLNSDGGGFPVGLHSPSHRFWALLHKLNTKRVAGLVKRDVQISFGSVLLMPEEVDQLANGDVIVLEEAQGPELQGDLLIEGQSAYPIVVTPSKATIVPPPEEETPPNSAGELMLSFVPAKLAMTDNEIVALKVGTELPFQRPENGAVEILCNGEKAGSGNLVLQDGCMGIKVQEITR